MIENVQIKNNELKKLLVIGKPGSGKSTVCNVLSGCKHDDKRFETSPGSDSCTRTTTFRNVCFNNDRSKPISMIDTIGFDDPNNDTDAVVISDLVVKLKGQCDYINLFLITVNGQEPRLDDSLIAMLKVREFNYYPT